MSIRPNPVSYICLACNWSKTVAPLSDALGPGDYFRKCPACESSNLITKRADAVQSTLVRLVDRIKRTLG